MNVVDVVPRFNEAFIIHREKYRRRYVTSLSHVRRINCSTCAGEMEGGLQTNQILGRETNPTFLFSVFD